MIYICQDKKTLIFDLDETLVHCNESSDMPSHVKIPIEFPEGQVVEVLEFILGWDQHQAKRDKEFEEIEREV